MKGIAIFAVCVCWQMAICLGQTDSVMNLKPVAITEVVPPIEQMNSEYPIEVASYQTHLHKSLANILTQLSSVYVKSSGNNSIATVSIRGMQSSHTIFTWNRVRLNNVFNAMQDVNIVPSSAFDKIIIRKGSHSIKSSGGGLGGSVELEESSSFQESSDSLLVSSQLGSFGEIGVSGRFAFKSNRWYTKVQAHYFQAKNDFTFLNTADGTFEKQKQKNANISKYGGVIHAMYKPNCSDTWNFQALYQHTLRNLPPIMSYSGKGRTEILKNNMIIHILSGEIIRSQLLHTFHLSHQFQESQYFLNHATPVGNYTLFDNVFNFHSIQAIYRNKYFVNRTLLLNSSIEHRTQFANKNERDEIPDKLSHYKRFETGLTLDATYQPRHSEWSFTGTAREDVYQAKFLPIMWNVSTLYSLSCLPIHLIISTGQNAHYPSLNDLYWEPGGNENLHPERSTEADISVIYESKKESLIHVKLKSSAYFASIKNWISWTPSEYRYWEAENIAHVITSGAEMSAECKIQLENHIWSIRNTYTYTRTHNRLNDQQLIYIPHHRGNFNLSYEWKQKASIAYGYNYQSSVYTTLSEISERYSLSGFGLHRIQCGYQFDVKEGNVTCTIQVENIFNTDYQSILWRAMPGRSYHLMIELSI